MPRRPAEQPEKEEPPDEAEEEVEDEEGEEEESEEEEGEEEDEDDEDEDEEDEDEEELAIDEATGRTIVGGTIDYETRVYDSVLPPTALAALVADSTTAFTARTSEAGEYSAGSTFWVSAEAEPTTALESLALQIFRFHARDAKFDAATSGAEWWTQVIESDADIAFHWDRDYALEADQGIQIHPHLATVTYLVAGGAPTVVAARVSPLLAAESPAGAVPDATACMPRPCRHLSFDGRLLHGAPSSVATAPASGPAAKRVTFLVNCWFNHVPVGVEPLPGAVVKRLQRATKGGGSGAAAPPKLSLSAARETTARQMEVDRSTPAPTASWTFGDDARRMQLSLPWPRELRQRDAPSCVRMRFAPDVVSQVVHVQPKKRKGAKRRRGA